MHFPEAKVSRLLSERFDEIEAIWDRDPYDPVNACAVTIKEFMTTHRIAAVDEGVRRFVAFKEQQRHELAKVGLGAEGGETIDTNSQLALEPG